MFHKSQATGWADSASRLRWSKCGSAGAPSMVKLSDQAPANQLLSPRPVTWHRSGEAPSERSCGTSPVRNTRRDVTPVTLVFRCLRVIATLLMTLWNLASALKNAVFARGSLQKRIGNVSAYFSANDVVRRQCFCRCQSVILFDSAVHLVFWRLSQHSDSFHTVLH